MINIFFYNKFKDVEMINKISMNTVIKDGYIIIEKYDTKTNTLLIGGEHSSRSEILQGKFVTFQLTLEKIIDKLNSINEIRIPFKPKYNMELVDVIVNTVENNKCVHFLKEKAYIIY
jgi:hypothetical protein